MTIQHNVSYMVNSFINSLAIIAMIDTLEK